MSDNCSISEFREAIKRCQLSDVEEYSGSENVEDEDFETHSESNNFSNDDEEPGERMVESSDSEVDIDEDANDEGNSCPNVDFLQKFSHVNLEDEYSKARAVQAQIKLWEQLLAARIKLQRLLASANRLPQSEAEWQSLLQVTQNNPQYSRDSVICRRRIKSILDYLLTVQSALFSSNAATNFLVDACDELSLCKSESHCGSVAASSLNHANDDDEEILSSSDGQDSDDEKFGTSVTSKNGKLSKKNYRMVDYPNTLTKKHIAFQQYRDKILLHWYDKTRLANGKLGGKNDFAAFETNILHQIEQILADKNRLLKRRQLKRSTYDILGKNSSPTVAQSVGQVTDEMDQLDNDDHDEEIFDDDDFYHQLLREVIERKAAGITDQHALGKQWLEIQKLRSKAKKKLVDRKASKARKIRYDVMPKLVNFMAPTANNVFSVESRNDDTCLAVMNASLNVKAVYGTGRIKALARSMISKLEGYFFGCHSSLKPKWFQSLTQNLPDGAYLSLEDISKFDSDIVILSEPLKKRLGQFSKYSKIIEFNEDISAVRGRQPITCSPENCGLFIDNIPHDADEAWIKEALKQYGPPLLIQIPKSTKRGDHVKNHGFCFLYYSDPKVVQKIATKFRTNKPSQSIVPLVHVKEENDHKSSKQFKAVIDQEGMSLLKYQTIELESGSHHMFESSYEMEAKSKNTQICVKAYVNDGTHVKMEQKSCTSHLDRTGRTSSTNINSARVEKVIYGDKSDSKITCLESALSVSTKLKTDAVQQAEDQEFKDNETVSQKTPCVDKKKSPYSAKSSDSPGSHRYNLRSSAVLSGEKELLEKVPPCSSKKRPAKNVKMIGEPSGSKDAIPVSADEIDSTEAKKTGAKTTKVDLGSSVKGDSKQVQGSLKSDRKRKRGRKTDSPIKKEGGNEVKKSVILQEKLVQTKAEKYADQSKTGEKSLTQKLTRKVNNISLATSSKRRRHYGRNNDEKCDENTLGCQKMDPQENDSPLETSSKEKKREKRKIPTSSQQESEKDIGMTRKKMRIGEDKFTIVEGQRGRKRRRGLYTKKLRNLRSRFKRTQMMAHTNVYTYPEWMRMKEEYRALQKRNFSILKGQVNKIPLGIKSPDYKSMRGRDKLIMKAVLFNEKRLEQRFTGNTVVLEN